MKPVYHDFTCDTAPILVDPWTAEQASRYLDRAGWAYSLTPNKADSLWTLTVPAFRRNAAQAMISSLCAASWALED